jgi:hypothetical protein
MRTLARLIREVKVVRPAYNFHEVPSIQIFLSAGEVGKKKKGVADHYQKKRKQNWIFC